MDPITSAILMQLWPVHRRSQENRRHRSGGSYNGLKTLLQKKSGQDKKLIDAVHELEQDTSSDGRKMIVQEEVKKAGADKDEEILAAAERLLKLVQPQSDNKAINTGSGAIAQGKGAIAVGAGGIAVGGDVQSGINMPERRDDGEE